MTEKKFIETIHKIADDLVELMGMGSLVTGIVSVDLMSAETLIQDPGVLNALWKNEIRVGG